MIERRLLRLGRLVTVEERRVVRHNEFGKVWGKWRVATITPQAWRAWLALRTSTM